MRALIEPVTGRYVHFELGGRDYRVFFEEAGDGIPLLCLHTAGADSRQFRGLLNDPRITGRFRVIAFDLPWHGKSSPPEGWQGEQWRLTSASYCELILAFMQAIDLSDPVVMGCSIGGRICLNLALDYPSRFRAIIGLQSAASTPRYYDPSWLAHPEVNGPVAGAATVMGLMSPQSPAADRWETLWHYMQGGPGVFAGDLHFYQVEGDFSERVHDIDTGITPLYLLTGEYDYSCSAQDTLDTAVRIAGADVRIMPGLGHFPMSENPRAFIEQLLPVLGEIASTGESA
ncbi:MAG: alpha/beta hydrolase [Burkholderiales bacterium]|jgi:pimeloyl-ACP methyl ester carboxylesterase